LVSFVNNERRPNNLPEFSSQTGRTLLNLREMLLRGEFKPGERLSELPLVARLNVSRTPIRLALDRLANEGLLESWPTGGFVVRAFTFADVYDAIELRGVLEGTAARLAAERLEDRSELAGLCSIQEELSRVIPPAAELPPTIDSFARYLDLNASFHATLVDLAKSPMLRRTLDRVQSLPFASPSATVFARLKLPQAKELLALAEDQHNAIISAIQDRQGNRAETLAREHAGLALRNLEAAMADKEALLHVPGASLIRMPAASR
jgi:GntR family transcriptional regulator, vanillate catabolism transcriptional regulator